MVKLHFDSSKNNYTINYKKPFKAKLLEIKSITEVFEFAYEMCFGNGHHRSHRTGGQYGRKKGELFCNVFQGKLAEIAVYNLFNDNNIQCSQIDFGVYGKGIWDDSDIIANTKKINIKSASFFSNLLLLETKDWNQLGQYIPNIEGSSTSIYDYFILVRIGPDLKKIFKRQRWLYSNTIHHKELKMVIENEKWYYDIPGFCDLKMFKEVIEKKQIIPQNSILNHNTKMDAENYYIQSGDLMAIEILIHTLNSITS